MIYKIDISPVDEKNYRDWYEGYEVINNARPSEISVLSGLNKINVFIGQNNSGKSRFLRKLYSEEAYRFHSDLKLEEVIQKVIKNQEDISNLLMENDYQPKETFVNNLNDFLKYNCLNYTREGNNVHQFSGLKSYVEYLLELKDLPVSPKYSPPKPTSKSSDSILCEIKKWTQDIKADLLKVNEKLSSNIRYNRIYIPILRGLRALGKGDIYKDNINGKHFQQSNIYSRVKENIYTGLGIYDDITKLLLGTKEERDRVKRFERFIGDKFYGGKDITLIPKHDSDALYIGIDKDKETSIYDLGDGVQAIITLLYPIFFQPVDTELLVFIEEPEIFLHPGFQRLFIDALLDKQFDHCQFFFTTHSNHFLDISLETKKISVYTFNRKSCDDDHPTFKIIQSLGSDLKILDLLGVRNSSVFLSNCTIWVEGITDRLYIRKYLELYLEKIKEEGDNVFTYLEDIHYSFVEYSGSNITHWNFDNKNTSEDILASRISNKIFIIADTDGTSDDGKDAKSERLRSLRELLDQNFYKLPCIEIENSLKYEVIEKTIAEMEGKSVKEIQKKNSSAPADFANVKLGKYINDNFVVNRKFQGKSGTIISKVSFCETAIKIMSDSKMLSDIGYELAEKIYSFIKAANNNC